MPTYPIESSKPTSTRLSLRLLIHSTLNMFSRVALFALLALPAFATPLVARGGGSVQCCNNVEQVSLDVNYTVEFTNTSHRLEAIAQIRYTSLSFSE